MARGSKDWNKKSTMSLQTHSCQIHKRCAIFRLMAINTSSKLQHSSNLYFHESSFFSLSLSLHFSCREQLFHSLSFGTCGIAQWFSIAAPTAVLCAPSKAEHNRAAACVTIQGSSLWLVSSCALQLGPQTTHPAAPRPSSDPSGNMALMVACLT